MSVHGLYRAVTRSMTNKVRGTISRWFPVFYSALPSIKIESEAEYLDALNRYVVVTLSLHGQGTSIQTPETIELLEAMREFESRAFRYRIVCTRDHYAGLGVYWTKGQLYDEFFVREQAEGYLRVLNKDKAQICWGMQIQPPS